MQLTIMARDLLMLSLRLRLMLPILDMDIPMLMVHMLLMYHLDPALVLTQSPKVWTLSPKELFLTMVMAMQLTIMARDQQMLMLHT